ncbi:MAG: hypothetical protein K6A79_07970 [Ruminococcus sp.]|jgi:hypothetical protein|nr:hypothetical protein [Ruminococcus sp.]MCR5075720.1 hypothetical protein [Ruminococcus sp.]
MGSQFWWFYDIVAAAVFLVCIFLAGKKGVLRGAIAAVGCVIALALALGISTGAADGVYQNTMRSSNIKKVAKVIRQDVFLYKYAAYLESLDANIDPSYDRLDAIFSSENKNYDEQLSKYINNINGRRLYDDEETLRVVHEGYAVVIGELVSQSMNKYAAEVAMKEIRKNPETMQELIPMIHFREEGESVPPAKFITDNYTAPAYVTIYKLAGLLIVFILAFLFTLYMSYSIASKQEPSRPVEYIISGSTGIFTGAAIVFIIAAAVRLWAVLGSNEMLFFNNEVIDRSLIFKYFYNLVSKL